MDRSINLLIVAVACLALGGCGRLGNDSSAVPTPTPLPLEQVMLLLESDGGGSSRELITALFELERQVPPAVKAIPLLIRFLEYDDPEIRVRAINALAGMGNAGNCVVPRIAAHLWDSTGFVRTGAAAALDHMTQVDLVDPYEKYEPLQNGFTYDEPEGWLSGKAREWWMSEGQYRNWSPEEEYCVP